MGRSWAEVGQNSLVRSGVECGNSFCSSRQPDEWDSCLLTNGGLGSVFFSWPIHHQHAPGSSFESVQHRAEQKYLHQPATERAPNGGNKLMSVSTSGLGKKRSWLPATDGRP